MRAVILSLFAIAAPAALAEAAEASSALPSLPVIWWIAPAGSLAALLTAYLFYRSVVSREEGTPAMIEIAEAVRQGAMAYLKRQYRVVAVIFALLFALFLVMAFGLKTQNKVVPFAFLTGGFFSGLCGFFGMKTATQASARTANAARQSLNSGLQVAFRAGAVMGFVVVGFALLDIAGWFLILYYGFPAILPDFFDANPLQQITVVMLSFGMGASTQALFARVGGGIYTKAADVGADIVGKVEAGIPEDDPRNAAVVADNVGDNVGDVAGMGADLYESYAGSILATAALGVSAALLQSQADTSFLDPVEGSLMAMQIKFLSAPMILAGIGIFLSIIGVYLVRTREEATMRNLLSALSRSVNFSSVAIALLALGALYLLDMPFKWRIWGAIVTGLIAGVVIGKSTEYYTSQEYRPTKGLANQALTGSATAIIDGIAVGMQSTGIPMITIAAAILLSYYLPGGGENPMLGLYGIGISAVGMLSTLGLTLATDAYGPIADNAGGNAEMCGLDASVRQRTDQLDALGNTTAATGKGFAIGSAALTALALLAAYIEELRYALDHLVGQEALDIKTHIGGELVTRSVPIGEATIADFMTYYDITLMNPNVLIGLFIGSAMAFFFCALTMKAVGRAAGAMVAEVRRQFDDDPGIMEGTSKPDYARCVEISTAGAQREMVAPALLAIAAPIVVGLLLSVPGILGLLAGGLATGFVLAVMMANAGGAWDNAKKYIEEGHHGGKGSEAHKAAVVGDTVGDPFKDTSGPSLNILIKLMAMVSIVFAGFIAKFAGVEGLLQQILG